MSEQDYNGGYQDGSHGGDCNKPCEAAVRESELKRNADYHRGYVAGEKNISRASSNS
jgi:hypothetical protein